MTNISTNRWLKQVDAALKRARPARRGQSAKNRQTACTVPLQLEQLEERSVPAMILKPQFVPFEPIGVLQPQGGSSSPSGTTPAEMRTAYGVNVATFGSIAGTGAGQTIAIIDAYNQPDIVSDLAAFDAYYSLPAPPNFRVLNQTGGTTLPANASVGGWGVEISLDVEWAHVIAPNANIILFEANSNSDTDLYTAVDTARNYTGVSVVSMSFGGGEFSGETSDDYHFTTPSGHNGVTFLAATGDDGASGGPIYPSASPNVVAVGGTTLNFGTGGTYTSESGWSGSGGGPSLYESQPAFQSGIVTQSTTKRTTPDVSMDANPNTGVPVYDTFDFGATTPWAQYGGTSLATPLWAGVIAIADQGRTLFDLGTLDGPTETLPTLYSLPYTALHDITTGNNYYAAGPGYDLVTGRGSPIVNVLVNDLVPLYADTRWAGMANGTVITDADPVQAGNQTATFGVSAFSSVDAAIAYAVANGSSWIVVNGDTSGIYGNFGEAVSIATGVNLIIQYGPVSFNSLSDSSTASSVMLDGYALTVGSNNTSTQVAASISGTGSLIMDGSGTLTLSGQDVYTGATTVELGELMAGSASAFASSSATTVDSSATLDLNGFSESVGSLAGSGTVQNASATPATLTVGSLDTSTSFGGALQDGAGGGALSLVLSGTGNLTLSAASTYSGTTTVNGGELLLAPTGSETGTSTISSSGGGLLGGTGTINATTINATVSPGLTAGAAGTLNSGNLTLGPGSDYIVDLDSASSFDQINVVGTVNLSGATLTINGNYVAPLGATFVIINNDGADPVTGTFNGLPEGSIITSGTENFRISYVGGDGNDVTLTATNTLYVEASWASDSPGTVIADADPEKAGNQQAIYGTTAFGTVTAALAAANPGDSIIVNAGTYHEDVVVNEAVTLTVQQSNSSFYSLADTVSNAALQLAGVTLTVGSDGATTQFSSPISGTGSLAKTGAGTMTLAGTNSYTGGTTISGGVLQLGSANAIAANTSVADTAGTLRLDGFSLTLSSLTGAGSVDDTNAAAATLTVGSLNAGSTFSGTLLNGIGAGVLSVTKIGTGTLTLSGTNSSYTGATTIDAGTLSAAALANGGSNSSIGAASSAAAYLVLAGGTLQYTGSSTTINRSISLTGASTVNVSTSSATLTTSGTVSGGTNTLTKLGSGALTFSTNNALTTGNIYASAGTLGIATQTLSSAQVLTIASGAFVQSTGTLNLSANASTHPNIEVAGAGTLQLRSTTNSASSPDIYFNSNDVDGATTNWGTEISANIDLGSSQRYIWGKTNHNCFDIYGQSADAYFGGVISGSGGMTFIAQDTYTGSNAMEVPFVLAGANTFTGEVEIQRGSVYLDNANALNKGNVLLLDPGSGNNARLFLWGNSASVSNLSSSGTGVATIANGNRPSGSSNVALAAATLTDTQTSSSTYAGTIADSFLEYSNTGTQTVGSVSLVKAGAGALTLSGANSFSGTTTVNAGDLSISSDNNLGTAPGSATVGKLVLNGGTLLATSAFTLNSNRGIAVGPSSGSGSGEVDVAASQTLTYAGIIANNGSGTGSLLVGSGANTGTFLCSTANALNTGDITVNSGALGINTIALSNSRVLSIAAGANVNSFGTINLTADPSTHPNVQVSGAGTLNLTSTTNNASTPDIFFNYNDANNSTNWGTGISANINLGSAQRYFFGLDNHDSYGTYGPSADAYLSGVISGAGGISFIAQNSYQNAEASQTDFVLAGANTFSGEVEIQRGAVYLANAAALSQNNVLVLDPAAGFNSWFYLYGTSTTISNLQSSGAGTAIIANSPGNAIPAATLTVMETANTTFAGAFADVQSDYGGSGTVGSLSIAKAGAGTLTLSGASSNSGTTTVNAGLLRISSDSNLGSAPATATAGNIVLNGGTLLASASFTLNSNRGITLGDPVTPSTGGEIDVATGATLTYDGIVADNAGAGDILTVGSGTNAGTLILGGAETYTGPTSVNVGTLQVNGTLSSMSNVTVAAGATLDGAGDVPATVAVTGTIEAGAGAGAATAILTTGNLSFASGGTVAAVLAGTTAGSGYDQLSSAAVNLTGASLAATLGAGFTPAAGASFEIISNAGSNPVTGTFTGLPQGAATTIGGLSFTISYTGGDGNDVVLTYAAQAATTTTVANTGMQGSVNLGPATSTIGQTVAFGITVAPTIPNGEMATLWEVGTPNVQIGAGTVTAGQVVVNYSFPGAGTYQIFAVYGGDTNYAGSQSSNVTQVVHPIQVTSVVTNGDYMPAVGASEAGNTVTLITDGANGFSVGNQIVVNGFTAAGYTGYDGNWTITAVSGNTVQYTDTNTGLAATVNNTQTGPYVISANTASDLAPGIGSANQRSMVDSIVYTFNTPVNLAANAFTMGVLTPTTVGPATPATGDPNYVLTSPDGGTTWVVTWTNGANNTVLGHSIADGVYTITLNSSAVTAVSGGATMTTTRPTDTFYRLYGDFNGTKKVNGTSANKFNTTVNINNGGTGYLAYFDYNSDGKVNATDSNQFNARLNTTWSNFTPTI